MARKKGLLSSFFWVYLGVSIFGAVIITLDNLFINGLTLKSLMVYNFKAVTMQIMGLLVVFQVYGTIRLRIVRRFFIGEQVDSYQVRKRLLRFPAEMFWAMVLFGLVGSPLYHYRQILAFNLDDFLRFVKSFCFEFSLVLLLAVLLFTLLRRRIRPILVQLVDEEADQVRSTTILTPLLITFISLMLIMMLSMSFYILNSLLYGKPLQLSVLFSIGLFTLLFGIVLFVLIVAEFRRDLRVLIDGIHALSKGDRKHLQGTVPILFHDEAGQLGIRFNQLQKRVADSYSEIDKELELAYKVQQTLLPPAELQIKQVDIAAFCLPAKEVGGDFYDIVPLDENRFAVIIGDITGKGMPAALIMSAMLLLVRTEIRKGGTPGEILTRLNPVVLETVSEETYLTIALAIFDHKHYTCQFASAGHVSPYRLVLEELKQMTDSSIPLGLIEGEVYTDQTIGLQPGEQVIFYTDGMIEAYDSTGKWVGFQGLEQVLLQMDQTLPVKERLDRLKSQYLNRNDHPYDDDKTMVLIQF